MHRLFGIVLLVAAIFTSEAWANPRLGTNLSALVDWSSERPFINLFKQSRPWFTQCDNTRDADCGGRWATNEDAKLNLDANGWVKSLPPPANPGYSIAATVLDVAKTFPVGRYLVLYDGEGTLNYRLGAQKLAAESKPGRDVVDINVSRGLIHIQLMDTDPNKTGNYIRNIRLIREKDESLLQQGKVFSPDFLARIQPFAALRFKDWMTPYSGEYPTWDKRPLPGRATYATYADSTIGLGVPVEIALTLANQTNKSPWFSVPYKATDNEMRAFAETVRNNLNPTIPVYVEYSYNIWDSPRSGWMQAQADALWPKEPNSWYRLFNWYGKRSAEMCDIWKSAFASRASQVVCVISGMTGNSGLAQQALDCPLWVNKPCYGHGVTALGIAPTFGAYIGLPKYKSEIQAWTKSADGGLEKLFTELERGGVLLDSPVGGALGQAMDWVNSYRTLAATRGLRLVASQGGQGLVPIGIQLDDPAIPRLFNQANQDPRMGRLYMNYLRQWETLGGDLMFHFNDIEPQSKWGSWGALEDALQTHSPKYDALVDYLTGTEYEAVVTLNASASSMLEKGGVVTLTAMLDKAQTKPISLTLNYGGNATFGKDYQPSATVLTIPAGSTVGTLQLKALDDALIESTEKITLAVGSVTGTARAISATLQVNLTQEDTDADGMPDDWERYYGLNPSNAADASTDFDGDGVSNKNEYLAATEPNFRDSAKPVLGSNLAGVSDWTSEMPFTDLFKMSRNWITQCNPYGTAKDPGCNTSWDTNEESLLNLDANGWVKSLPKPEDSPVYTRVSTYWAMYPEFKGGRYIVLYEGEGTLAYGFKAQKIVAESRAGRDVIQLNPAADGTSILLTIMATDPNKTGNYIRNIRVIPEAYENTYTRQVFNPDFLNRIRPYQALRFMDWMATNGNEQEKWANRPLPTDARYTNFGHAIGMPAEIMIQLANELNTSPWFNLPHKADDDYIRQFATLARDTLKPHNKIYVELSNEVWNGIFSQANYALAQARLTWPDSTADDHTLRLNWYGKRSAEMCDIWKQIFANDASRVVCVIGGQAAWSTPALQALDCPLWKEGPCYQHGINALAIAPYFGGQLASKELEGWLKDTDGGLGRVFEELTNGKVLSTSPGTGAVQAVTGWIDVHQQIAQQRGLQLVSYEGGQHMADIWGTLSTGVINLLSQANRDPRIGKVYRDYLDAWKSHAGGGLFMHFMDIADAGRYGAWGALEHVGQTSSAKYNALLGYLADNIPDTTPDAFSFTAQVGVGLSAMVESNAITISGINTPTSISISGGDYSVNGGAYTFVAATVKNGDKVQLRHTASASFAGSVTTTLTIGGVSSSFKSTTLAKDTTPATFSFTSQTGVRLASVVESNAVTVSGINAPASISVSTGSSYSVNGGAYTTVAGTVSNSNTVKVRHTSSSKPSTSTITTLTIGGVTGQFSSKTVP